MDTILYDQLLFDYYGTLLTKKQQNILELYYEENLTLSEIAEKTKTSRQAVHDTLKRAHHSLQNYENQLALIATDSKRIKLIEKIKSKLLVIRENNRLSESDDKRLEDVLVLLDKLYREEENDL